MKGIFINFEHLFKSNKKSGGFVYKSPFTERAVVIPFPKNIEFYSVIELVSIVDGDVKDIDIKVVDENYFNNTGYIPDYDINPNELSGIIFAGGESFPVLK